MADTESTPDARPSKATPVEAGEPVEVEAVTGRPVDKRAENTTFAARAKARSKQSKAVDDTTAENKAVKKATRK